MRRTLGFASGHAVIALAALAAPNALSAQPAAPSTREQIQAASEAERAREMTLLGITALRPTVGARDPAAPDFANFDETKANPYPNLPPLLITGAGKPVTTAAQWRDVRRPEIVRLWNDNVYGHVPADVPKVTWRVTETVNDMIGGVPVVTRKLVGHTDNARAPTINVDIQMTVTVPAAAQGKHVPAVMLFGSTAPRPPSLAAFRISEPEGPSDREQIIAKGWAIVLLDPSSVQADNAAGLDKGIVGLTNRGEPRSMSDWGALRAWGWGASRGMDYLATDPDVDARRVAIFGHSRYGKAALVALAYEPRIATGYISSSGAGGAALYRRNYGEGIPNLAAANEFHWFAGNFLKYAAVGHSPDEMPVDSHELIALVAPRPLFIGGGALMLTPIESVPGDAWVDATGMFKAAAAASPAWALFRRQGLQTTTEPAPLTYLGAGDIGFRQHQYGHTPKPNWSYFIQFASKYFDRPAR